jgi:hypothetical protein
VGHFPQAVAAQAEIAEVTPGTPGFPAAVAQACGRAGPREFLQLGVQLHAGGLVDVGIGHGRFQLLALLPILLDQALALFLPLDHALFSHGSLFPQIFQFY